MTNPSQAASAGMTAPQQQLVGRLEHELVAPCCYSQVVADHMSEEAAEMRQEIEQAVLSGRCEGQILDAYKARYGAVILAAPDGFAGTIAFSVPPFCALAGMLLVVMQLRRWRKRNGQHMAGEGAMPVFNGDPRLLARIRADLGQGD